MKLGILIFSMLSILSVHALLPKLAQLEKELMAENKGEGEEEPDNLDVRPYEPLSQNLRKHA